MADVILPIGALPEIDATLTNLDGLDQYAVAGGKLPGESRAGWRVLRALGAGLGIAGFDFIDLVGLRTGLDPRTIGRASLRERAGQYGELLVGDVEYKKKK